MANTKKLYSVLLLVAVPVSMEMKSTPVHGETAGAERQMQLAQARELLGSDSIHLSSAAIRKVEQVHDFVRRYVRATLKGADRKQADRLSKTIISESRRYGFDPLLLLAVISNESRFDPSVIGSFGEIGLMQIKPDTAEWIAKRARIRFLGAKALHDPSYNVRLGSAYLAMLRAEFGFHKDLYLAAYNMGSTNVRKALSNNLRPQIYAQKTIQHYSRIYIQFLEGREEKNPSRSASMAFAAL